MITIMITTHPTALLTLNVRIRPLLTPTLSILVNYLYYRSTYKVFGPSSSNLKNLFPYLNLINVNLELFANKSFGRFLIMQIFKFPTIIP